MITNYVKKLLSINNKLIAAEGTSKKNAPIWDQIDEQYPNLLIFLNNFDNEIPEKKEIELTVGVHSHTRSPRGYNEWEPLLEWYGIFSRSRSHVQKCGCTSYSTEQAFKQLDDFILLMVSDLAKIRSSGGRYFSQTDWDENCFLHTQAYQSLQHTRSALPGAPRKRGNHLWIT